MSFKLITCVLGRILSYFVLFFESLKIVCDCFKLLTSLGYFR